MLVLCVCRLSEHPGVRVLLLEEGRTPHHTHWTRRGEEKEDWMEGPCWREHSIEIKQSGYRYVFI